MTAILQVFGLEANGEGDAIELRTQLSTGETVNFSEYQITDILKWIADGLIDDRTSHLFLFDPIVLVDEIQTREQACREALRSLGYVTEDGEVYHLEAS